MTETKAGSPPDGRPDAEKLAGHRLRQLRTARNWPLREVAERMKAFGYNWHMTVVAKIETGQRPLRLNEALDLVALFGVRLEELLLDTAAAESLDIEAIDKEIAEKSAELDAARRESATAAKVAEFQKASLHEASEALAAANIRIGQLTLVLGLLREMRDLGPLTQRRRRMGTDGPPGAW